MAKPNPIREMNTGGGSLRALRPRGHTQRPLLQYAQMKRSEFQRVIQRALEELPPQFQDALHNIDIHGGSLFGLYTGVSLPRRSQGYSMVLPDRIIIYQRTHEMHCATEEEMVEQARKTLLHEVGHYLGIDERRLRELGVG